MHEINNINKRLRTIKHFSNYFLVALIIGVLTGIIVLAANGYDIDRSTGQVIQNGILLVETDPRGASVSINGQEESARTPAKYPIPAGRYEVMIDKPGYRAWTSQVEIFGSSVNWLYYPALVPESIETRTVAAVDNLNFVANSLQRNAVITSLASNPRSLTLYDVGASELTPQPVVIPDSVFFLEDNAPIGKLSFVEWSKTGRHILLRYEVNNQDDLVLVDLEDAGRTTNLDRLYNRDFDSVEFTDDESRSFLLSKGSLFEADLNQVTISSPLDTDVTDMHEHQGKVWVIKNTGTATELTLLGSPEVVLVSVPGVARVVSIDDWEGTENVIIDTGDQVLVYKSPSLDSIEKNVVSKLLELNEHTNTTTSPNGRFVALHNEADTLVYDLDNLNTYMVGVGADQQIRWLDGHRLSYDANGQLFIVDFDGNNDYQIAGYDSAFPAMVDREFDAIYTIAPRSVNRQLLLRQSDLELN